MLVFSHSSFDHLEGIFRHYRRYTARDFNAVIMIHAHIGFVAEHSVECAVVKGFAFLRFESSCIQAMHDFGNRLSVSVTLEYFSHYWSF